MESRTRGARMNPLWWLGIALVVALVLLVTFVALSASASGGYGGFMGMMGSGMGVGILYMAVPGIFLVVLLVLILVALSDRVGPAPPPSNAPLPATAFDILDERYAKGELTPEQYARMKQEIQRR